jgi:hypothetical protein
VILGFTFGMLGAGVDSTAIVAVLGAVAVLLEAGSRFVGSRVIAETT